MSKPLKRPAPHGRLEDEFARRPILILEKQLMDTLELCRYVRQARICSRATNIKMLSLLDGMALELQVFTDKIRRRLDSWREVIPHFTKIDESPYWRLFAAESVDAHDQVEVLLCGYARYERQTLAARAGLERSGDLESSRLLAGILKAVERCLWFLEIYMESLAVNADMSRLPDWQATI